MEYLIIEIISNRKRSLLQRNTAESLIDNGYASLIKHCPTLSDGVMAMLADDRMTAKIAELIRE